MPRRGNVPKREILPDPMYNSVLVTKLVNSIMLDGKKGVAQKVVYGAFDIIKEKTEKEPLEVFTQAMENIMPSLEVKARRVGGATYHTIPYEYGLIGHSDADVVVHAIMDALLGAAALGDIGKHFPDNDEQYKDISSIILLEHVGKLLKDNNYTIGNIDATIIAQKPKLAPYREQMVKNVAKALNINENQVCIKATTEEGLGFTGEGLGISSQAIALLN